MLCDLSAAKFHVGMFTEYTFVLAEGSYDDVNSVFRVTGVGLPPPEPPKITRNYFGNTNFFGGPSPTCVSSVQVLRDIEREKQDVMFVFVSGEKQGCTCTLCTFFVHCCTSVNLQVDVNCTVRLGYDLVLKTANYSLSRQLLSCLEDNYTIC